MTFAKTGSALRRRMRFWAEDLVYTSSVKTRANKAEILAGCGETVPDEEDGEAPPYHAEDVDIRLYGDTAVVACSNHRHGERKLIFDGRHLLRRPQHYQPSSTSKVRPASRRSRSIRRSPKIVAGVQKPPAVFSFPMSRARHRPAWLSIFAVEP